MSFEYHVDHHKEKILVVKINEVLDSASQQEIWQGQYDRLRLVNYDDFHDLSFLLPCKDLIRKLTLYGVTYDTTSVSQLSKIEQLSIYQKSAPMDFSVFPDLNYLSVRWLKGYKTDFLMTAPLKELSIESWTYKDFQPFSDAHMLESLTFHGGSLQSFAGVERMPALTKLESLYCRNLHDLSHVAQSRSLQLLSLCNTPKIDLIPDLSACVSLERIAMENVTVLSGNYEAVFSAPNLKHLYLMEIKPQFTFPSLAPFCIDKQMESFSISCIIEQVDWELLFSSRTLKGFAFWFIHRDKTYLQDLIDHYAQKHGRSIMSQDFMVNRGGRAHISINFY